MKAGETMKITTGIQYTGVWNLILKKLRIKKDLKLEISITSNRINIISSHPELIHRMIIDRHTGHLKQIKSLERDTIVMLLASFSLSLVST